MANRFDVMWVGEPLGRDVAKAGAKRAKERQEAKNKLGYTNEFVNFWTAYSGRDEKAKEKYRTENPLFEEQMRKNHPNYTEEQFNKVRDNHIRKEILKNSKHPAVQELYNSIFDKDGKMTDAGKLKWLDVKNDMAKIAMENDIDGISDEKEERKDKKWHERAADAFFDTYDVGPRTTMREAAKKYLNESVNSTENTKNYKNYYNWLNSESVDAEGKTKQDRINDFDNLAQMVSQDYKILMNPEQYKDLQDYDRLKDVDGLRLTDEEKLQLYAQFYVDLQRGGEKYALQKLGQFFTDRIANNQTAWEKAMNFTARVSDDVTSSLIGVVGIAYGLSPLGWIGQASGFNDQLGLALGLYTEEDLKRRHNQRGWQNIFDNPLVQYSNNLMDTHVYDPKAQVRMLEEGLSDNQFYKTVEQQESLFSIPQLLEIGSDYGFTAGMTIASFGATGAAKAVTRGALRAYRGISGITDAAQWNKALRASIKAKNFLSVKNGAIVATAEGAGITLKDKQENFHNGYVGLQNKYFEEKVRQDPYMAAAVLQNAGIEDVPQGQMSVNAEGYGKQQYTDEEIQKILELFSQNMDNPNVEYFKQNEIKKYENENADIVSKDYEELQDRVEDAATAEFIIQAAINGFINHGLKNTLNSKSLQKARKDFARRIGLNPKNDGTKLSERVIIEQAENGKWVANAVTKKKWDVVKERLKESAGEGIEEWSQDVATAFGTGYYDYAYQNFINSRFGDNNGVNESVGYTVGDALLSGLQSAGSAAVSDEALTSGIFGAVSSAMGGFNVNEKFFTGQGKLSSRWSPITWRGAWTPAILSGDIKVENARNQQLADHINKFFNNKEIQEKLTTAGGISTFIKKYNEALANGDSFDAKNQQFGEIFSVANMLDKLKGTAYHEMVTNSLDKREALDFMSDDQIKRELENPDSDASQALKEYKNFLENRSADHAENVDFSPSDENVKIVRQIAQNATKLKYTLNTIAEKREQIQRDFGAELDDDAMDAALFQQISIEDMQERADKIDGKLNEVSSFDSNAQAQNTSKQTIVKYGSLENLRAEKEKLQQQRDGIQTSIDVNEEKVKEIRNKQKEYKKALEKSKGKETDETKELALTQQEKETLSSYNLAKAYVDMLDSQLSDINKQDEALSKVVESKIKEKQKEQVAAKEGETEAKETKETPVLSEQEIMELDAASRAYMLNEKNKKQYSQKQQEVIDALNAKGHNKYGKEWDRMIEDSSRLQQQIIKDQTQQNSILQDSKILQNYVNNAKITRLKREKAKQYEPLFVDANHALQNEDPENPDSTAARKQAVTKLAQFLNNPAEDYITAEVKKDLAKKYAKSRAMQTINSQDDELEAFADNMDNVGYIMEEIQQSDNSSVDSSENKPSKKVTRERDLTDEDNYLMACALQYASDNGIALDELPDAVTTEDFKNYTAKWNEIQKEKGTPAHVELNPVDAKRLMEAVIKLHHKFEEDKKADELEKQKRKEEVKAAQSPVPEVVKPGQKDKEKKEEESEDKEREPSEAYEIGVANLMNKVDDEVERLVGDESQWNKIKQEFKDTIEKFSKKYDNIRALQAALFRKYNTSSLKRGIAQALNKPVNTQTRDAAPNELETQNLTNFPEGSVVGDYIVAKRIRQNYNRVAKARHDAGVNGKDFEVMFMYDPTLDNDVAEKMGGEYNENQIPIVLVVPITEENRQRLGITDEDEANLIDLGKNDFEGKGIKYMPIGVMPSSTNKKIASSSRMKAIRKQVDTGLAKGGENQPRILRYRNGNTYSDGTPKENGGRISAIIANMNPDADDPVRSNASIPLRELSELGIENVSNPEESIITEPISERDRKAYEVARGDRKKLRATKLYKNIRAAILERLKSKKVEYTTSEGELKTRQALKYNVIKGDRTIEGTEGEFLGEVIIKPIEETSHRDNPEVKLIDLIRQFSEDNDISDQIIGNGKGDNGANSRLTGLYQALSNLFDKKDSKDKNPVANAGWPLDTSQFDSDGRLDPDAESEYNETMKSFADQFKKKLNSYLDIAGGIDVEVKVDKVNPVDQKTLTVTIKNKGNELASITLNRNEALGKKHVMSLVKQCILDDNQNVRESGKFDKITGKPYGLVKWQVNFQDANSNEKIDQDTYNDTYDDGILTMRLSKLAYRPATVKMTITPTMRTGLYGESGSDRGSGSSGSPTGSGPKHEKKAGNGAAIDVNSGMVTKKASADVTSNDVDPRIQKVIGPLRQMLEDSKSRKLSDNEKTYEIRGQKHARVTSIKRFFSRSKSDRFDETSPWGLPSTAIGNSLDEFGRDVLNNVFDDLNETQRKEIFASYPNSTAVNYEAVYQKMKKIQANLASQGQTIIAIGNADNPGSIVASGAIPVKMGDGTTKMLRVGGTLDVLAVDSDGNFHIYDFKTYHSNAELNEETSDKKDYDIQLSLYAKFLEQEYGIKVKSINVIPVHTPYPTPKGVGGSVEYTRENPGSEQLLSNGQRFTGAAFEMKDPFPLTRLSDEELTIAFDKLMAEMTDEEKELLADTLGDQYNQPIRPQDIGEPEGDQGEGPQPEGTRELADPVTMGDDDIKDELSSLEGKDDDESNARRDSLQAQQNIRQDIYQDVQSKYLPGVKVHSDSYGDGTVVGYDTSIGGVQTMIIQFGDQQRKFNILANVEGSLEIIDVPPTVLDNAPTGAEKTEPQQKKQEKKSPERKGSNYRVEEADSVRRKPKRQLKKRAPAPKSDTQITDELQKRKDAKTLLEDQEDQCKKK